MNLIFNDEYYEVNFNYNQLFYEDQNHHP